MSGALQTRGTCWFYSILNGFILSEAGQKILYLKLKEFYSKLNADEKAYFNDGIDAPCPMNDLTKTKQIYFWKFIDQYLCFMSGPRALSRKAGKSAELLGAMSLAGSFAKQTQGSKGAWPQVEIANILNHVGFSKNYYIKYAADPPRFHAGRKPQFVVVMQNNYNKKAYMLKIPKGLMNDSAYELTCASLVIANTNAPASEQHKWHAVAGFVENGEGYIWDSNQRKKFKCDWWDLDEFKRVANEEVAQHYSFFRDGKINIHYYAFAIFARKEAIRGVAPACLMKYTAKTPVTALNFTDPNTGRIINSNRYNYLKPAERVALKRKWARTDHKTPLYITKDTFNSILRTAMNRNNGYRMVFNLQNAGYKIKNENFKKFNSNLMTKFPIKKASPKEGKTYTFTNAKAHLNQFTKSTAAVRKHQYSLAWKGIPMAQRRVLMHWRNTGEWLANNAFENKPKTMIKKKSPKPKPATPSPTPRTKRAAIVRANFEKYWLGSQPENRQLIRNYIAAYKSPVSNINQKKKHLFGTPSPVKYTLSAAKRNVNALKTAKARKEYKRTRAGNLSQSNWMNLHRYVEKKNYEAQRARAAKREARTAK